MASLGRAAGTVKPLSELTHAHTPSQTPPFASNPSQFRQCRRCTRKPQHPMPTTSNTTDLKAWQTHMCMNTHTHHITPYTCRPCGEDFSSSLFFSWGHLFFFFICSTTFVHAAEHVQHNFLILPGADSCGANYTKAVCFGRIRTIQCVWSGGRGFSLPHGSY